MVGRRRTPDHFARRAKKENYPARSVYKLEEIDRRFNSAYTFHWREAVFPPMATQWAVVYGEPTGRAERADVIWPEAA